MPDADANVHKAHHSTHLRDLGLAAFHRLGELLQLRSDLAEGDRRLEMPVTPLQIV